MRASHRSILLRAVSLSMLAAAGGCGTCVSVEATYDDVWEATRAAFRAQPALQRVQPVERYDAGTIEAVVIRVNVGDELHYRAEIKPAGGDEVAKHQVCVWVQEVDAPLDDRAAGPLGKMQSQRRRDLETMVTAIVEHAFAPPETPPAAPAAEEPR